MFLTVLELFWKNYSLLYTIQYTVYSEYVHCLQHVCYFGKIKVYFTTIYIVQYVRYYGKICLVTFSALMTGA